jgi:hypothetical protein
MMMSTIQAPSENFVAAKMIATSPVVTAPTMLTGMLQR